jgi:antirestriction protein
VVTTASNYKTFLQESTIDHIDARLEENFHLDDMLEFIDEHSENDFILYYEDYVEQGEALGYEIVDAFVSENCIGEVASAQDAYVGWYQSESDFAEEYTHENEKIPACIVVDWEATWDRNLQYDFDSVNAKKYGVHIFRRYY